METSDIENSANQQSIKRMENVVEMDKDQVSNMNEDNVNPANKRQKYESECPNNLNNEYPNSNNEYNENPNSNSEININEEENCEQSNKKYSALELMEQEIAMAENSGATSLQDFSLQISANEQINNELETSVETSTENKENCSKPEEFLTEEEKAKKHIDALLKKPRHHPQQTVYVCNNLAELINQRTKKKNDELKKERDICEIKVKKSEFQGPR